MSVELENENAFTEGNPSEICVFIFPQHAMFFFDLDQAET